MSTTYETTTDVPSSVLEPGEVAFKLTADPGNGKYVAGLWKVKRLENNTVHAGWYLREVDTSGNSVLDGHGNPIEGEATEQTTVPMIRAMSNGIDTLKQQLLDIAMDDPAKIRDVIDDIRDAIEASSFIT